MPEEWKEFYVQTLKDNSSNTPLSYAVNLSESIKDGIQNNTRLQLSNDESKAQVYIEGDIVSYGVSPVALQEGDNSALNRLTVSVQFRILTTEPEEDEMSLTSTRYLDYDSNTDLGVVEDQLLEEINEQIVQDVINKLLSNW
jgi:outer membrane lipopolysaccharide assembly protein LptE/RlpB